jgi:hypothetical protein
MSLAAIRSALETQLATITPALVTAYENAPYTPVAGTPYQAPYVLLAQPDNSEIGPGFNDQGIFQVNLFYPKDAGPAAAQARAELIRTAFPFAASFVSGTTTVNITATPEVAPARAEDDRYLLPVKVRFRARTGG